MYSVCAWHDAQSQEKRNPGTDRYVAEGQPAEAASFRYCVVLCCLTGGNDTVCA
jgi:hypothetical protein